jgi:hypothetical protein
MAEIKGLEGMSLDDIQRELSHGGRFVIFSYCVSPLLITLQRPSAIYFLRGHESALIKGLPYTLLTALAGWWGIPWGPIFSIHALAINLRGGRDITNEILCDLAYQGQEAQPRASRIIDNSPDTIA